MQDEAFREVTKQTKKAGHVPISGDPQTLPHNWVSLHFKDTTFYELKMCLKIPGSPQEKIWGNNSTICVSIFILVYNTIYAKIKPNNNQNICWKQSYIKLLSIVCNNFLQFLINIFFIHSFTIIHHSFWKSRTNHWKLKARFLMQNNILLKKIWCSKCPWIDVKNCICVTIECSLRLNINTFIFIFQLWFVSFVQRYT